MYIVVVVVVSGVRAYEMESIECVDDVEEWMQICDTPKKVTSNQCSSQSEHTVCAARYIGLKIKYLYVKQKDTPERTNRSKGSWPMTDTHPDTETQKARGTDRKWWLTITADDRVEILTEKINFTEKSFIYFLII